jgi:hypothetical protein
MKDDNDSTVGFGKIVAITVNKWRKPRASLPTWWSCFYTSGMADKEEIVADFDVATLTEAETRQRHS